VRRKPERLLKRRGGRGGGSTEKCAAEECDHKALTECWEMYMMDREEAQGGPKGISVKAYSFY